MNPRPSYSDDKLAFGCKTDDNRDLFEDLACYNSYGNIELDYMAAMAKCPSNFDCGSEFVFLEGKETLSFNISKVHKNGLCIYNVYTDPDEGH